MKGLWAKVVGLFGFIATILGLVISIYNKGRKSAANEIKAKSEEEAREVEKAGSEAIISDIQKQQEIRDEKIDHSRRDHFH